jgi:hypothetical protein
MAANIPIFGTPRPESWFDRDWQGTDIRRHCAVCNLVPVPLTQRRALVAPLFTIHQTVEDAPDMRLYTPLERRIQMRSSHPVGPPSAPDQTSPASARNIRTSGTWCI